jgi:cell wall-associated NlpC family hydrolase
MLLRILTKIIAIVVMVLAVPMHRAASQRRGKSHQEFSGSTLTLRDSVVALARAQVGKRYVVGGASPKTGFDCSGLVKYVLRSLEIELPRTARAQAKSGWAVARDPRVLRPGDLLLFGKKQDGISHVGIYVGNGHFVHASSVAGRVIESPLYRPASSMIRVLKSARRVLAFTDSVPVMFNTHVSAALSSSITTLSARLP